MKSKTIKSCSHCEKTFKPRNSLQKVCSTPCAIKHARAIESKKASKALTKDLKARREALKPLGKHKDELQAVFNKFIRLRDKDEPCISCQRHHQGQYHAGHYLTVGARPNLRYDENNVHKQCAPCNNHLSGNITNYRINLVDKIGLDEVERLECDHEPKHYTVDDIVILKGRYKLKIKEIEKGLQG